MAGTKPSTPSTDSPDTMNFPGPTNSTRERETELNVTVLSLKSLLGTTILVDMMGLRDGVVMLSLLRV